MHFERSHSPQASLKIFEEEIVKLDLTYKVTSIGSDPQTTRCWLLQSDQTIADVGNGKGLGLQSEISAKYEALEHYLSTQKSELQKECVISSFEEIQDNFSDINQKALPFGYLKSCDKNIKTPWVPFRGYFGSSIILPYFLTNPEYINRPFLFDDFDYSKLSDIPTNNGTAIGSTYEEAMVHAVNELIERDAISCFLLSTFCRDLPKKLNVVDKESLPPYLSEVITTIERKYNEELLIIDIMNDLEVPVFLTAFTKQNQRIQPIGFGASLNSNYALERAILEALQSLHLYDDIMIEEDNKILNKFREWPKLQKCAQCNLLPLMRANHYVKSRFQKQTSDAGNLAGILDSIVRKLDGKNFHVFYAKHYQSENGITCVKVVIPGIEQFHRVRLGNFVLPGERGISML